MARRIQGNIVKFLYQAGYSQGDIAFVYGSVSGHISKVLKAEGVVARKRGEKVRFIPYSKMPEKAVKVLETAGLSDNMIELETRKAEGGKVTGKAAKPVPKATADKTVNKPAAKTTKAEATKKKAAPLTEKQLDKACFEVLKLLLKNTPLKEYKGRILPEWMNDSFDKGKRVCITKLDYRDTRDLFNWIDSENVYEYHYPVSAEHEDNADEFMDYLYDAYAVVDANHCSNLANVYTYAKKLGKQLEKSYPNLDFHIDVYGIKYDFTIYISCVNKSR